MQMFQAFNFRVEIRLPESSHPLCEASFSECDGLEVTREVKSIREGGNNSTHLRLPGGVSYGQVTLKRGMTRGFDLWKWFDQSVSSPALRASIDVVMLTAAREEAVRFTLTRALPVKLKAPALNARDGVIAIEELGVLFERMEVRYA